MSSSKDNIKKQSVKDRLQTIYKNPLVIEYLKKNILKATNSSIKRII